MDWFNPTPDEIQETTVEPTTQELLTEQTTQEQTTQEQTTQEQAIQEQAIQEQAIQEQAIQEPLTETTTETVTDINKDINSYNDAEISNKSFEINLNEEKENRKEFEDNIPWKPTYDNDGSFWVDESYQSSEQDIYDIDTGSEDGVNSVIDNNKVTIKEKTQWGISDKSSNGFSTEAKEVSDRLGSQNVKKEMTYRVKTLSTYDRSFTRVEPKQLTTLSTMQLPEPVITKPSIITPIIFFIVAISLTVYIKISKSVYLKRKEEYDLEKSKEQALSTIEFKNINFDEYFEGDEENDTII